MAFNAGSIDATLTLNRNPFTAGLAAARNQARSFANERYEATLKVKVDDTELNKVQKETANFAKQSRTATAKVNVDRLMFDKLVKDLREFGRQTYTATVRVNTKDSSSAIRSLIKDLGDGDSTVKRFGSSVENETNRSSKAFKGMDGTVRAVLMTLPLLLPVAGSAITGVIGLVGALASTLVVAGAGAGAFALVAVPVFKKVQEAAAGSIADINKLPPGLREAALSLKNLTTAYTDLQNKTQKGVGQAMAAGFNAATVAVKTLAPVINAMSAVLVKIGGEIQQYFGTAHWKTFVDFLSKNVGPVFQLLWDIVKNLANAVINLTEAFMPLGTWLLKGIATGMADFAKWTSTLAKDPAFQNWIGLVKDSLTKFWDLLVEVVKFIFNLATALTPLGNIILGVLTAIFTGLNKIPPEWLAAIAMGLSAIFAAVLLGASPQVAIVIGAIAALASGFKTLYDNSAPFRDMVNRIWDDLKTRFIPIFVDLADKLRTMVGPELENLRNFFETRFLPAFEKFYNAVAPILAWLMETIGTKLVEIIRNAVMSIEGILQTLTGAFELIAGILTGDWSLMWQGLKDIGEGSLNAIVGLFGVKMSDIVNYFQTQFVPDMQGTWDTFWTGLKTGWETTIGPPLTDTWRTFLKGLNTVLGQEDGTIQTAWTTFWTDAKTKAMQIWNDDLLPEWKKFVDSIKTIWDGGTPPLVTDWNNFWAGQQKTFDDFNASFGKAFHEFLLGLADGLTGGDGQKLLDEWKKKWDQTKIDAAAKWEEIKKGWHEFLVWLGFAVDEDAPGTKSKWDTFWQGVHDKVMGDIWPKIQQGWTDFWAVHLDPETQKWLAKLKTDWDTFWDGLGEKVFGDAWPKIQQGWIDFWGGQNETQTTGQAESDASNKSFWQTMGENIGNFIRDAQNNWVSFWGGVRTEQDGSQTQVNGSWNDFWAGLGKTFSDWWAKTSKEWTDFWAGVGKTTTDAKDNIIRIVADAVVGITNAWHGVANAFRDPINWVINTVINDGILKGWNTVMGWIGAPGLNVAPVPQIPGYAAGGPITGGIPGRDSVPIMAMPGEYVFSTAAVKALGGTTAVDSLHKQARGGARKNQSTGSLLPGYADGGPIGGIIGGIAGGLMDVAGLFGAIPKVVPGIGGPIGAGISKIPEALIGKVVEAGTKKVTDFLATIAAAIGGGGSAVASGPIAQIIQQTAAQFGWGSGPQLAALNWIISHESGFNPNAQNPTSTAYGLFQFLNGTWASTGIAKTADPSLQALAGMRYIASRYGTPVGAQAFWQANGWYDNGGWLAPGRTMAVNGTGSPEAVLTAPQWDAVMSNKSNDDILRKLDQLIDVMKDGGTGSTVNIVGTQDPAENARRAVLALKLRRR